ncbi:putative DNA methylase [Enhygromyxa salina]|uniref:site-specific DNA-methyltransferase (adenine-specific) n=1 Tax=Enhygromyxa salina TaxID=215803 RepID=A0A0C2D3F0_9BACT|nr:BREX-2 system adenine-specific DNA-methyltransferase PglX [Enhygromyxa salina]KIG17731.1 putative DNA methylase [Enhygromyxa salina]
MARSRKTKTSELVAQTTRNAPLDSAVLLAHATPVLAMLTADLLKRADGSPAVTRALKERHASEKSNNLTADTYAVWRRQIVVQIAASWLLSCVFVRTLEDRGLLESNRIAGEGALGAQHSFFQIAPYLTERDYLLTVFRELEHYPAARSLFDREHNLAWRLTPSANAAKQLLELFRTPTADAPAFRFGQADTRFLGDLYQDLSEEVRKRYALLQTPDFIEAFILDRTLDPAIEEFGLEETDLIDPTCGSGHFLLGAFARFHDRWLARGVSTEEAVEKSLGAVYGVDVNPYAVSIARFRLTLAALEKLGARSLRGAPGLDINVAVADSLIDGEFAQLPGVDAAQWGDAFNFVDERAAKRILRKSYAAVVGNPPYIAVKDKARRERYRERYEAAAGKYSLAAPFMERFFQLARSGGGFTGQITANSFTKRDFGTGLIQVVLPKEDLQLIVNTAGAYIPGHGTPTVLVFGRHQMPESPHVHAVLARRGEPATPDDPANGLVWSSIREHWQEEGFENEYITVEVLDRGKLAVHPWCLEGGGAAAVKALLEARAAQQLGNIAESIGISAFTLEDDVYLRPLGVWDRLGVAPDLRRVMVVGEAVRDWGVSDCEWAFFPYDSELGPLCADELMRPLWPYRASLSNNKLFGQKTKVEGGLHWYEYGRLTVSKLRTPLAITFAFVATHNHFVLDRGGKVFNRSAPIIKLPETATEEDHLALLAYLNSSTACFWMKQMFFDKGNRGEGGGITSEPWEKFFEYDGTKLARLPVPALDGQSKQRAVDLARLCMTLAAERAAAVSIGFDIDASDSVSRRITAVNLNIERIEDRLRSAQEELDWIYYAAFGLLAEVPDVPVGLGRGDRPSDRAAARFSIDTGLDHRYFQLCNLPSASDILARTETSYHSEVRAAVEGSRQLALLEEMRHKRTYREGLRPPDFGVQFEAFLLEAIEKAIKQRFVVWVLGQVALPTEWRTMFAAIHGADAPPDFVRDLLKGESIPFLTVFYLKPSGLEKRRVWESVWDLQRTEDSGAKLKISAPPKYSRGDFSENSYSLRGPLDVPKERFISYPGCESDKDSEPVYGWAGWDHAQRAEALAALYVDRKDNEAWTKERLQPMLAGLLELLPWVKQWHPEPDPDTGEPFGVFLEQWLEGECRLHGFTHDDLRDWRPPTTRGRKKKKTAKKKTAKKKAAKQATAKKDPS